MTASTSLMVPDKHLTRVAGMNQLLQGVVSIFAPPLGALLLELCCRPRACWRSISSPPPLAVLPLLFIAIPQPPRQVAQANGTAQKTSYWQDLRAGFPLRGRMAGPVRPDPAGDAAQLPAQPEFSSLLPLLVMQEFDGGAPELAWVELLFGVGVILGGMALSAWGGFKRRILTSFVGIIGIGRGRDPDRACPGESCSG